MTKIHRSTPPVAKRLLCIALMQVGVGTEAFAATDSERMSDLERRLEQSQAQIQQLSRRLVQLEGATPAPKAAAPAASAASAALADKVSELEQKVSAMEHRPEPDRGLEMHGFADVGLAAASKDRPGGFNVGALDFYLTPKFGDRVRGLFEVNFEVDSEGHVGVDVERLQIGYTLADSVTLWAGRFHTPFGYWNTAYHHGAQLQTSILRPMFLDFEDAGGVLPVHTVGLWTNGSTRSEGGRFNYDLYVGNSPSIQMADPTQPGSGTLDPGLAGALNRTATVGANLGYVFRGSLEGLSVGLHGLSSEVVDTLSTPDTTRLVFVGGWMVFQEYDWEVLAEQYSFRNRDLSGGSGTHASNAGYVQIGRQFGAWTPYGRYEITHFDQTDAYFAQQASGQSYRRYAAGLRFDLNPKTAIKVEANRTQLNDRATGSYSELRAQFAIRF